MPVVRGLPYDLLLMNRHLEERRVMIMMMVVVLAKQSLHKVKDCIVDVDVDMVENTGDIVVVVVAAVVVAVVAEKDHMDVL